VASSGKMIVLDGPDGCGKTTQAGLLVEAMRGRGLSVLAVRDPGGTALSERIRRLLLGPDAGDISARAEVLLYMASRAELVARIIRPALEQGRIVIADRFYSSSAAYQGVGRGLGVEEVLALARFACDGVEPTLTIILDMDPMDAFRRRGAQAADRIERRPIEYHQRVRLGFQEFAQAFPERVRLISAAQPIEVVAAGVMAEVERVL
jgi:dTMP kinase